ncbi:hypothetical protein R7236_26125 [Priestia megaterium]|uniref:hypothetical protein n=1 Tax=Priestia megaterium TaxID=1404 RepID=UPI00296E8DC2|nr:hypothetical protein [Priestia megaterium]MDW4511855.1 hypothetical protein [Priestia megaterium]
MKAKKYKFNKNTKIKNPLRVFFLCGTKFFKDEEEDKRNVLKKYIETKYAPNGKVIILEEHFMFGEAGNGYLSYDKIFMRNLKDIELLTGLYSDKIFIIHESISTAAELGMFASNMSLLKKTCLMIPDILSVEEDKISAFIRLAYFKHPSEEEKIEKITFYPKIRNNIVSETKIDYHTFFPGNSIRKRLALQIDQFIQKDYDENFEINFKKNQFNKAFEGDNIISYFYYDKPDEKTLNVTFPPSVLRMLLIALFNITEFKQELRKAPNISKTVGVVEKFFKSIIRESVSHIEAISFSDYEMNLLLKGENIKIRQAIAYFLYMLQALGMLKLPDDKENKQQLVITTQFKQLYEANFNILKEIKKSKLTDSL